MRPNLRLYPHSAIHSRFENLLAKYSASILLAFAAFGLFVIFAKQPTVHAGEVSSASGYNVLDPIGHGNLTVFPVIAPKTYPTGEFLTLDEGLRSGDVIITESGMTRGLIRRHSHNPPVIGDGAGNGAQVNRLVLINNSSRPLLLLAGEIVTGGKQDRVIGKDRIVPAESDPIDLSVFCVEPGRWVATSEHFGASESTYAAKGVPAPAAPVTLMAQPSVRSKAMAEKDQNQVWEAVRKQQSEAEEIVAANPSVSPSAGAQEIQSTSSYARVMENKAVKQQVDEVAKPIEQNYQSLIKQLRDRNAVGVVVAVNGRIIWADIFASSDLLQKYWPKLVRSYASEAFVAGNVSRPKGMDSGTRQARAFLDDMEGRREMIENEPGVYRHTEVSGDGFKAFSLTSLLPKTGFEVHIAKMAE